jgi:hypothetical protein
MDWGLVGALLSVPLKMVVKIGRTREGRFR